jgi:hypothetical protein
LRAIRAFERAYEISGSPALLFNLGQANRLAGPERCAKALEYYELYLRLDKDAPNRTESERRVAEMRACITHSGAEGETDAGAAPPPATSALPPARAPEVLDAGATAAPVSVPTPPSPAPTEPRSVAPAAYVLGAVGVAGVAVFATFALLGKSEQHRLESTCSPQCPPADVDALRTKFLIADLALVAGVVSLGATTYIVMSSGPGRGSIGVAGSF